MVYQDGNITGALINGAGGEKDAAHIEQILYDLLLETDEHHVLEARLMLFRLLQEKSKLDTLESVTRVWGVAIDPNLPVGFFDNYSGHRPISHMMWYRVPFVRREFSPDGYAVYCFDNSLKGRPTRIGFFETRDEAVEKTMPHA